MVYVPNGEGLGVSRRLPDDERARLRKIVKALARKRAASSSAPRPRAPRPTTSSATSSSSTPLEGDPGPRRGASTRRRWSTRRPTSRCGSCATCSPATSSAPWSTTSALRAHRRLPEEHLAAHGRAGRPLQGAAAAVRGVRGRRRAARRSSGASSPFRRLPDHRLHRSHHGHRRQHRRLRRLAPRTSSARLEDTVTKNNLEAAKEVVRQLRLRDIGGIIVIDFIDMANPNNRAAVRRRCATSSSATGPRPTWSRSPRSAWSR